MFLSSLDEPRSRSATLTVDKIPYQRTRGRPRTSSIHDLLEQQIRASHVSLPAIHAPKYSRGTYKGEPGREATEGAPSRGVPLRMHQVRSSLRMHQVRGFTKGELSRGGSTEGAPGQGFHQGFTKSGVLLRLHQVRGSIEGVLSQGFHWEKDH